MNKNIIECISDSDLCNKISVIPFATNPREVVSVGDMMDYYYGIYMGSLYGKWEKVK